MTWTNHFSTLMKEMKDSLPESEGSWWRTAVGLKNEGRKLVKEGKMSDMSNKKMKEDKKRSVKDDGEGGR